MLSYYWRWIETAIGHSFSLSQGFVTFVGVWIIPGAKVVLGRDISMSGELLWNVMAGMAVTLVAMRLVFAPYWMHKEDESKRKQLQHDVEVAHVASSRVDHARAILLKHADEAPVESGYMSDKGETWLYGADVLLGELVNNGTAVRFLRGSSSLKFSEHRVSVASLRGIAGSLQNADLIER